MKTLAHRLIQGGSRLTSRNKLPILIYHQVLAQPDPYRPCTPTAEQFRRQMIILQRYFNPLSVDEALPLLRNNQLPANSICVTFDDGYLNNLTIAAPILKELEIPATVYVASAFTGADNMWNDQLIDFLSDEEHTEYDLSIIDAGNHVIINNRQRHQLIDTVLKHVKYMPIAQRLDLVEQLLTSHHHQEQTAKMMNQEQLAQLSHYGVSVAAHTHDHPIMAVLPLAEQREQLQRNIDCLTQWQVAGESLGFAYPNGKLDHDFSQETADLVKEMGLSYAVTTHAGICTPDSDVFQLPRASSWEKRPLRFHLRLLLDIIRA